MFTGMPDFKQSMEMMKNMWANAAKGSADSPTGFSMPGMQGFNSMGIPTMDIEEIDKRIKDLKSVESWLTLNLQVLQGTIQGLEVQRATLNTLQGIADTLKASTGAKTSPTADSTKAPIQDFVGASGTLAKELMEQMSHSANHMMSAFVTPSALLNQSLKSQLPKKLPLRKPPNPVRAHLALKSFVMP
ncbi:MAG: hypothetical protein EBQ70_04905 [Betaproteobacteria bacterium]|nr:hypothetical protein [Betaproteobacteria bacterium]